jgi:hypothetical protein
MPPAALEVRRVTVSTAIPITLSVTLVLARLGRDDRDLNFFFVLLPFFNVKPIVLDLFVDRALWIKHEPQSSAALGCGVYRQSSVNLLRCLNELRRRDGRWMPIRHA